jgi:two-component system sensor histidine kinase DesK
MIATLWTPHRPYRLMVTATVAVTMVGAFDKYFGIPGIPARLSLFPGLFTAALIALQLRHSNAAARGERPRGGTWTLLALALLVYGPMVKYTYDWAGNQALIIASALMVVRPRRLALAIATAPVVGTIVYMIVFWQTHGGGIKDTAFEAGFWAISIPMVAAVVYGAARMVRGANELQSARTELAELAIAQERLRVSRDLHDLVGQSLSAVSLRGDLALRLLDADPAAAEAEIAILTATARDALHNVLTVTSDSGAADLGTEAEGARALLAAAGIEARVELTLAGLPLAAMTVFAWALREGVTNVLRHSEATECSIAVAPTSGAMVRLEIVNDGVRTPAADGRVSPASQVTGNGLTGLAERAKTFSGELTAGVLPGGLFRLCVDVPGEMP